MLKFKNSSLVNSLSLIFVGLWGYIEVTSPTALIPVIFGIGILVAYYLSIKFPEKKKIFVHIVLLLTILIFFSLISTRLSKSIDAGDLSLLRVIIMLTTSLIALLSYTKIFIDNRKSKN